MSHENNPPKPANYYLFNIWHKAISKNIPIIKISAKNQTSLLIQACNTR